MEAVLFNVESGYAEALCRGLSSSLIKSAQYSNMTQCDTLEDLKLQLGATDYAQSLANVASPISTSDFQNRLFAKLVADFRYLQTTAVEPSSKFLEYITYGYMIDNVVLMVSGTLHHRNKEELLERAHPLGWFDTLPALSVTTDIESLYDVVLVDTPLAPYFKECFTVAQISDLQIEIIRNKLYRAYLEDFAQFCKTLPGSTYESMIKMLGFEADCRTINIAVNSNGTGLSRADREALMPRLGALYPVISSQLARSEDPEQVRAVVEQCAVPEFTDCFDSSNGQTLEDHFYAEGIVLCREALTQQFSYATFYAWLKAAEQEVRNVTWIAECIAQNQRERISGYVSLF